MTVYGRLLLAGVGSALLLLAALGFQYLGGLEPCTLCIWQRWPHLAAVVIALLACTLLWRMHRAMAAAGAAAMVAATGLAAYHFGVEQGWWPGPSGCSAPDTRGLSGPELLDRILETDMVSCTEVVWRFLGLSMAAWNAILSAGLLALWVWSTRPQPPLPAKGS